jgi:predicted negative regulator of RcsB-dependent stress response
MRVLRFVVVLFVVGIVGMGFYRGWFGFSTNSTERTSSATVTVDKDKIQEDGQKAKNEMQSLRQEAKEKIGDSAGKTKE